MEELALDDLRRWGAELGLEVGATAVEPGPERERLLRWLAEGRHGELKWMERDPARRADPRLVLDGARAVVSIAAPAQPPPLRGGLGSARIARYAMGEDYHEVVLDKVRALAVRLGDPLARAYVDTGPVLEKVRAERAGLGWIGKHTNLVSRRLGSYFFLGAILTRRPIEVASPQRTLCGTCTRCLTACPTGAIRHDAPFQLDARRCISYLTIELRGSIPRELRPLVGAWVFGCDLCLDICPWNRFAQVAAERRLHPREDLDGVPLVELVRWSAETFRARTKGTPIRRTGRARLLRNAAVALGNVGGPGAVEALEEVLDVEPEALVREHAAWALAQLGAGADALRRAADADIASEVRAEARIALAALQSRGA